MKVSLGVAAVGGGSYLAYRGLRGGTKPKKPAALSGQLVVTRNPAAGHKPKSRSTRKKKPLVAEPVAPVIPKPVPIPVAQEPLVYQASSPIASPASRSPVGEVRRPIEKPSLSPVGVGSDGISVTVDKAISRTSSLAMPQPEEPWEEDAPLRRSPAISEPDDEPSSAPSPVVSLRSEYSREEEISFAEARPSLKDQLIKAVKDNDLATMKRLKNENPGADFSEVKIVEEYQESLLRRAIQYGHLDMVRWLIEEAQFDKDAPTDAVTGNTPLGVAALYGKTEIVRYLLSAGADPFIRNNDGRPPFGLAGDNPDHCNEIRNLLEPTPSVVGLVPTSAPDSVAHAIDGERSNPVHGNAVSVTDERPVHAGAGEPEPNGDDCSVCYESFGEESSLFTLPCKHVYHKHCLTSWFWEAPLNGVIVLHDDCPVCRGKVDQSVLDALRPSSSVGVAAASGSSPAALGAAAAPVVDLDQLARRLAENPQGVMIFFDQFKECLDRTGRNGCPAMRASYSHFAPVYALNGILPNVAPFIRENLRDYPGGTLFYCRCVNVYGHMVIGYYYAWQGENGWLLRPSQGLISENIATVHVSSVLGPDDLQSDWFQRLLPATAP